MKIRNHFCILLFAIFCLNCSARAQNKPATTEQERFKLGAEYSKEHRGLSVLVMRGDKVIFEEYQNGHTADTPHILASGTKSFSGVMLAAAIEDRLVKNFDEKVSDTITEWKADKQKAGITIRQLLSLTSGIDAGQIGVVPSYAESINSPVKYEAGTRFEYGPVPFQIFGEFMTRKLKPKKEVVMDYLKRRILNPIGLNVAFWRTDNGQPLLPQGASLTAREWVKFGIFLRDGGKWKGKQIVRKKLLQELVSGSKANPAYGITFWLNRDGQGPAGENTRRTGLSEEVKDIYMAAGAANQRLYIIPSEGLVIVRQGRMDQWDDREFLKRLLLGKTR